MKVILIGLGDISKHHIDVLSAHQCEIIGVYSRDYNETKEKAQKIGIPNIFRTFEETIEKSCDFYIIMTSAENNCNVLKKFIPLKKPILIEKPVGFSVLELNEAIMLNEKYNTPIMVGTNRRFYSIFHNALNFLNSNNLEIDSIYVEAPERFPDINKEKFSKNTKSHWMFVNSIHCIDLIRFFAGNVKEISSFSNDEKFVFNAIGVTDKDVRFVYNSNWNSPGSWLIVLYAKQTKIIFNPLEKGIIIEKNESVELEPSKHDISFKPGFYSQLEYFIENVVKLNKYPWPCSNLKDHKKSLDLIEKIFPKELKL